MRKIRVYKGKPSEVENRIVTKKEATRGFLKLQFKAEWGSVLAGDIPILEYRTLKKVATNKKGTTNIGYKGMSKGDELDIIHTPFEKTLIGVCEDINVKITDLSLKKIHEWEKKLNMFLDSEDDEGPVLDLCFENFKPEDNYNDYLENINNIPALIIDGVEISNNPQKWFFERVDIQRFKKVTSFLKEGMKIDVELYCTYGKVHSLFFSGG